MKYLKNRVANLIFKSMYTYLRQMTNPYLNNIDYDGDNNRLCKKIYMKTIFQDKNAIKNLVC